jgi:hypothetical protein
MTRQQAAIIPPGPPASPRTAAVLAGMRRDDVSYLDARAGYLRAYSLLVCMHPDLGLPLPPYR